MPVVSRIGDKRFLLSIIIIAHNEDRHIAECLDSMIGQAYRPLELIVVNDNSTDNTSDILKQYAKKHSDLITVRNEQMLGAGQSRNIGIQLATGEYIMFVDGDDYLAKESLHNLAQQIHDEKPDLLVFNHKLVYANGLILEARQSQLLDNAKNLKGDQQKQLLLGLYQIACNKVYRANFITEQALLFKDGNYEDTAYAYKALLLADKVSVSTQAYYCYRQRSGTAPYRPNKKESRVNQNHLVLRYIEIFTFLEHNGLQQFAGAIYRKMLIQFNAVIGERYDSKDQSLFIKMKEALIQYQPEIIDWPTFRSRIAYFCLRFGMIRTLILLNRFYSVCQKIRYSELSFVL